jgi:hypothetical protein
MSVDMKRLLRGIFPALVVLPLALHAGQDRGLGYEFVQDGESYSLRGWFLAKAELSCLMNVVFAFDHISKFASGAESVGLLEEGEGWHDVAYTYRRLVIFENRSTWRRTLKEEEQKVVFEMLTSKNNMRIIPQVLSSRGYYRISREGEEYLLEYFQECRLRGGILRGWYIERAKSEAVGFLEEFKDYVESTCGDLDP